MRNLQNVQVRTSSGFEKICPFPIGYIYMSTKSTSPASTYGGTWSALTDSRFLRPSGSWNSTGGSNNSSFTLPYLRTITEEVGSSTGSHLGLASDYEVGVSAQGRVVLGSGPLSVQGQVTTVSTLPVYRTCYAWYRTA